MNNRFGELYTRPYFCGYIGRKSHKSYCHTHDEILGRFGGSIVYHGPMSGIFSAAMGDYGYLCRSAELPVILAMAEFALQKTS